MNWVYVGMCGIQYLKNIFTNIHNIAFTCLYCVWFICFILSALDQGTNLVCHCGRINFFVLALFLCFAVSYFLCLSFALGLRLSLGEIHSVSLCLYFYCSCTGALYTPKTFIRTVQYIHPSRELIYWMFAHKR